MAQWLQLLSIDSAYQELVMAVYKEQTTLWDARRCLTHWIEGQNWASVAADERQARDAYDELQHQVEDRYGHQVQTRNLLGGTNYLQLGHDLRACFEANPVNMALIISRCLSEEQRIIASARMNLQDCKANEAMLQSQTVLDNYIGELGETIQLADCEIKSIDKQLGNYDFAVKALQDKVEQLNGAPESTLQGMQMSINTIYSALNQTRLDVYHLIGNSVEKAEQVVLKLVEEELRSWRLRQQKACIGAPLDTSLDKLQTWFTSTANALNQLLQLLRKLQELDQQSSPNDYLLSLRTQREETAQCLFTKLMKSALVVEAQPCTVSSSHRPLILKTGVRFSLKIRLLVNLSSFNWMPNVALYFDKDFDEIGAVNGFRKFNFSKKEVSKLLDMEKTSLVAEFKSLSLVEDKSKSNRQNESPLTVTEELHFITCVMELKLPGLTLDIKTSTLPLVVISSTNQSTAAWAAILWSAMVVDHWPKNLLFLNPPPVTWQQMSEVLSWQFKAMGERGLDEQQLGMLRDKFVDNHDGLVTWNKFFKCDGIWVWIEGILDLIKKHLLPIWRDGHIMGFISRESAITLLQNMPMGTFLLRFSESIKEGAITFSWVDKCNGVTKVHAVEPYKKELAINELADILRNYHLKEASNKSVNPLLYLYPDIPRDRAFQQYYSKPVENVNGYLQRKSGHWSMNPTPPPSPEENMCTGLDSMEFSTSVVEELFPQLSDMNCPIDPITFPLDELQTDGGCW